ncbi:hypothetical protein PanWU01x14_178980 [Parasponia andersonii]|uniref:Uncharacterized protein n=1 Tax=Parasponia andersonii TaxID=3476 RepID=A0A2P5C6H8_PARAD|nr:hypothetical protein PanWU01x14_178980 [Parasponia andersonii]
MKRGIESDCQTSFMDHLHENLAACKLEVEVMCREEDQDYIDKINELHDYLDMVMNMVKPGCSEQVLKVALGHMSSLVDTLSFMSLMAKLHASL